MSEPGAGGDVAIPAPAAGEAPASTAPRVTFAQLGLDPVLLKAVATMGFEAPTPIQEQTIPLVLAGRDVIGGAQTGTGKTAAFGLPILHRLLAGQASGIRALILEPTRELALQVEEHLRTLGQFTSLKVAVVYGGVGYGKQMDALRSGVDVVAATPGRLLDLHERRVARFDGIQVLVLDEADRMLDMGFAPDIHRIVGLLPPQRQNLLFSASIPPQIESLAGKILRDPARVMVAPPSRPVEGCRHVLYPVHRSQKREILLRLFREAWPVRSVLIFCETKEGADHLFSFLQEKGFSVGVLHADRSQAEREEAMAAFRQEKIQVLVATNVAARGLDITTISHVVNFDVPTHEEDYVHRIGRTARAEAEGDAWTLVSPEEEMHVKSIELLVGNPIARVTLPHFPYINAAPMIVYGEGGKRVRIVGGNRAQTRSLLRKRRRK